MKFGASWVIIDNLTVAKISKIPLFLFWQNTLLPRGAPLKTTKQFFSATGKSFCPKKLSGIFFVLILLYLKNQKTTIKDYMTIEPPPFPAEYSTWVR